MEAEMPAVNDKKLFYCWTRPADFLALTEKTINSNSDDWLIKPAFSWLREAWMISKLGIFLNADKVCLVESDPPDGRIRLNSKEMNVECVEALDPDRRRGDEYKNIRERKKTNPDENVHPVSPEELDKFMNVTAESFVEECLKSIKERCDSKANKGYSATTCLLIYANFSWLNTKLPEGWKSEDSQVLSRLSETTRTAGEKFQNVWVLFHNALYHTWEDKHCLAIKNIPEAK